MLFTQPMPVPLITDTPDNENQPNVGFTLNFRATDFKDYKEAFAALNSKAA